MTDIDKDWCLNMAALEGDAEIGAGSLSQHCPNCEAQAAEIDALHARIENLLSNIERLIDGNAALETEIEYLRKRVDSLIESMADITALAMPAQFVIDRAALGETK